MWFQYFINSMEILSYRCCNKDNNSDLNNYNENQACNQNNNIWMNCSYWKNGRDYNLVFPSGGRIDHAHHYNNPYRALDETLVLDDAVKTVLSTVDLTDTLVVVTSDHSHVMTLGGLATPRGNPILGKYWSQHVHRCPVLRNIALYKLQV